MKTIKLFYMYMIIFLVTSLVSMSLLIDCMYRTSIDTRLLLSYCNFHIDEIGKSILEKDSKIYVKLSEKWEITFILVGDTILTEDKIQKNIAHINKFIASLPIIVKKQYSFNFKLYQTKTNYNKGIKMINNELYYIVKLSSKEESFGISNGILLLFVFLIIFFLIYLNLTIKKTKKQIIFLIILIFCGVFHGYFLFVFCSSYPNEIEKCCLELIINDIYRDYYPLHNDSISIIKIKAMPWASRKLYIHIPKSSHKEHTLELVSQNLIIIIGKPLAQLYEIIPCS